MKAWLDKIKNLKRDQLMILLLAGVLLLVIVLPTEQEEQKETQQETRETENSAVYFSQTVQMENRLKQILAQVDGIGAAEVMLTLKSDGRSIVEKDLEQSQGEEASGAEGNEGSSTEIRSNESTVYQRDSYGNETPYVTETLNPEIEGVLVIAQGADDATVVNEITEAVMALFGVPAHKIKVMKMK